MPYLSDYKAILFDLDRTLIPKTREIFPEVATMLKTLGELGIVTGVCTGRGYGAIVNKIIPLFPKNSIHIVAGGALVINAEGQVLWEKTIDPQVTKELKKLVITTASVGIFMKANGQYAFKETLENIKKHPWNQVCKDLATMPNQGVGLVYIAKPNQKLSEYIENNPHLNFKAMVDNHDRPYYDITAKGVNKALAIKEWVKATGISQDKIIGFGDSINDLEFLQSCGFAVAMGNAEPAIKAIANRVIGDVKNKSLPNYVLNILKGAPL